MRARSLLVLLPLLAVLAGGCGRGAAPAPVPERSLDDFRQLQTMTDVFYRRISSRRVNSIATFHDPGLREFFHSRESFADYFADFVQALTDANFEKNRPEAMVIEDVLMTGDQQALVRVRFSGENAQPLRFWPVHMLREDHWENKEGRWWILPGKL